MSETRVGVSMTLPISIVERIDADRGGVPRSRFFERLVEQAYAKQGEKE
jgi:hypothetical protein